MRETWDAAWLQAHVCANAKSHICGSLIRSANVQKYALLGACERTRAIRASLGCPN